jgi:RecA-family ATPase
MAGLSNLMTAKVGSEVVRTNYVNRLLAIAKKIPDLKLIVLDPAARFQGGDENAAVDVTRFVEVMEHVSQETGATVIAIHHANKGSMNQGVPTSQAAARGSSAFTDGVRWQGNLVVLSEQDAKKYGVQAAERKKYIQLVVTKNNYGPLRDNIWFRLGKYGVPRSVEMTATDAAGNKDVLAHIITIIRERGEHGDEYSKRRFVERFSGKAGELQVGEKPLRNIIDCALEDGLLIQRPPKKVEKNVSLVLAIPEPEIVQDDEVLEVF